MKVDYSQFEHPHEWDNWFGTVRITDGASEKTVSAEIQTEEDFIPEASKKHLNPLSNAMPNIRKYWQNRFWNTMISADLHGEILRQMIPNIRKSKTVSSSGACIRSKAS